MAVYPIIYIPCDDDIGEEIDDDEDEDAIVINPLDLVITGSADNTARAWSFDTGGCLKVFKVGSLMLLKLILSIICL